MANGGNHALPPWDTLRDPGYLMVVDALTGAVLAKDTMPDGEETYCSPVVADLMQNGNLEIIYGSTLIMMLTWPLLTTYHYCYTMSYQTDWPN